MNHTKKHLWKEADVKLDKILFINLDRIGDVIRSTFLFRSIKKQCPHCYLACLTVEPADELLRNDPSIDSVLTLPHKDIRNLMQSEKTILHMCFPVFHLLNALKLHQFDLVINPFSEFGAMAVRYIKPQYVLGRVLDKKGKFVVHGKETAKFLYIMSNQKKIRSKLHCNFADMYAQILKDIDISVDHRDLYPKIYIGPHDEQCARDFLHKHTVSGNDLTIGFQIGAFSRDKRWPVKCFRDLAEQIHDVYNAQIIITGSSHEARTIVADMVSGMKKKPIIAAGKTDMRQTAAIISHCNIFVSNDTGPMHIAAALGIPIVALFGMQRSIPEESQPWGTAHIVIAREKIEDISVEEVFTAVEKQIKSIPVSSSLK